MQSGQLVTETYFKYLANLHLIHSLLSSIHHIKFDCLSVILSRIHFFLLDAIAESDFFLLLTVPDCHL